MPLLWMLSRVVGLGTPPLGGVLLLGGSAVAAWAGGGLLGAALGKGSHGLRKGGAAWLSALCGLVLGVVLCFIVTPLYVESVVESVTREAAMDIYERREELLSRAREAAVKAAQETARDPAQARESLRDANRWREQAARLGEKTLEGAGPAATAALSTGKKLALRAAAYLPAMTLLIWTLFGPAIAAFIEARRAVRY